MEKHVSLLAALQIGLSIVGLFIAAIIFFTVVGAGVISQDEEAFFVTSIVGSAIAMFFIVTCVPGIIGGVGLLKRKNWARILILVISAVDLLHVPIGTALAVYSFWVLLQDETVKLLSNES
ncbi:MAG: hypothetical protein ACE5HS_21665 [bacterium]